MLDGFTYDWHANKDINKPKHWPYYNTTAEHNTTITYTDMHMK